MSISLSRFSVVGCAVVSLFLLGCPPFQVTYPDYMDIDSQQFSIDAGNHLVIEVRFNEAVDMSSLIAQTNVILVTEKKANAPITIAAGASPNIITITSVDQTGDLLSFDPDGFFTLQVLGSGGNPVTSTDGSVLDGNKGGTAGGDFETTFVLIG